MEAVVGRCEPHHGLPAGLASRRFRALLVGFEPHEFRFGGLAETGGAQPAPVGKQNGERVAPRFELLAADPVLHPLQAKIAVGRGPGDGNRGVFQDEFSAFQPRRGGAGIGAGKVDAAAGAASPAIMANTAANGCLGDMLALSVTRT